MKKSSRIKDDCDRISALPEGVLCHILSFLPTKYSVRTRVLSTRWKYLFAFVPVLDFDTSLATKRNDLAISFVNFVIKVLGMYKLNDMRKFRLKFSCRHSYEDFYVPSWVSFAIFRNVQELDVFADFKEPKKRMPRNLLLIRALVVLKVRGPFIIQWGSFVSLPNLKTLHLVGVELDFGDSSRITFSGFPALENLRFHTWGDYKQTRKVIDISVPFLKKFKLHEPGYLDFEINAPALELLDFCGCISENTLIHSLNSLVAAQFRTYDEKDGTTILKLLDMASNVKFLHLRGRSMKVLRGFTMPVFLNLTQLKLDVRKLDGWKLLPNLLQSSPHLEILILKNGFGGNSEKSDNMEDVLAIHECACLSLHLKVIKFNLFYGEEDDFKLVEYFLKSARNLREMTIHTSIGVSLDKKHMISTRILNLSRYSNCQIVLDLDPKDEEVDKIWF